MTDGPIHAYRQLLAGGEIKPDPSQELAAEKLQSLHTALESYEPTMGAKGWMARLALGPRRELPRGIYMYGGVGRGKSMLMDLFFDCLPMEAKKHVHFHAFMRQVHSRLHSFRQAVKAGEVAEESDPLVALAEVIVDRAWLLCFDEFHVTDIADAMILGRLFEALFESGMVIVTTSNRPPRDLYKGGMQRQLFMPFIELFEEKLDILDLGSGTDFRLQRIRDMKVYLTPAGPQTDRILEEDFRRLITGAQPRPVGVAVDGRRVDIEMAAEGAALTGFGDLCALPLGAGDYLTIASLYHTVILKGIPRLGPENRNEAKRFITLIDALYEHKVNLICSAAAAPDELYTEGDGAFEFQRTASRLFEMQTEAYMSLPHVSG